MNFIGGVTGFPRASINRIIFEGEDTRAIAKEKWAGFTQEQLNQEASVDLALKNTFNASNNKLEIELTGSFLKDVNLVSPRYSVFLIENDIVDYQLDDEVLVPDYVHKHVFRDALTSFDGEIMDVETINGLEFNYTFEYLIPEDWNPSNINVIAFINDGAGDQEILQVLEKNILN